MSESRMYGQYTELINLIDVKGFNYPTIILDKLSEIRAETISLLARQGTHDASTGEYPSNEPNTGDYWVITVQGIIDLTIYYINDWIVWNGTGWDRMNNQGSPGSAAISDVAYGISWNGNTDGATKNAIYDKLQEFWGQVSDDAYPTGWNGDTTNAPSRNAVYDPLQAHYNDPDPAVHHSRYTDAEAKTACVTNIAYSGVWNVTLDLAPSKNAVYDKVNGLSLGSPISDDVYGIDWNGNTLCAASKNALYDEMNKFHNDVSDQEFLCDKISSFSEHGFFKVVNNTVYLFSAIGSDLQKAIDYLGNKGGTIVLPAETILLSATINLDGNGSYVIRGKGNNTIIDIGANRTAFSITNAKSCKLENFAIDMIDATDQSAYGIEITEANDNPIWIENITIYGDGTNGRGITINSDKVSVRNCYIYDLGGYYIVINGNDQSSVLDNILIDCTNEAIYIGNGSTRCVVNGNIIISPANYGIRFYGYSGTDVSYSTCNDNIIYDPVKYGIVLGEAVRTTVSGNIIIGNATQTDELYGIYIDAADYNTVSGNLIYNLTQNSTDTGAGIVLVNGSDNCNVNGNNVVNGTNSGVGVHYGLLIGAGCTETTMTGNMSLLNETQLLDNGTNSYVANNKTA